MNTKMKWTVLAVAVTAATGSMAVSAKGDVKNVTRNYTTNVDDTRNYETNVKNTNTNVNTDADAKSNAKSDANTGTNTAAYEIQN